MIANTLVKRCKRIVGPPYRAFFRWRYRQRQKSGQPVVCRLPRNVEFRLHPDGQIVEQMFLSRYERTELALVAHYVQAGMAVVDVGANVGLYSLLFHKLIGPRGTALAFEPSSETYGRLKKNLRLNDVKSLTTERLALSDQHGGQLILRRDPNFGDGERHIMRGPHATFAGGDAPDAGDIEHVDITTLDHYIDEHRPGLRVDFIKIDVEDHELSVLRGAKKLLTDSTGVALMLECTPQGCQRAGHMQADVYRFVRDLGLGVYCWKPRQKQWDSSEASLLQSGNIWAIRDRDRLPRL
jgi:FkbM family methyltransferase